MTASGSGAELHRDFLVRFDGLIRKVESVDLRVPEDSALIGLATDLQPKVSHLLRQGLELLTAIEAHYAALGDVPPVDRETDSAELRHIGMLISSEIASQELTDLAFFARNDVRSALEGLLGSASQRNPLIVASTCESGLRRLRKALVSVESAMCEFESLAAPERQWLDIEISLEIRKLYATLRRETLSAATVEDAALEDRLRSVLYRTVAFRELRIYPFLRVDDRVELRRILSRIVDWLNSADRDATSARRLWQDLAGFAEILSHVSYRQELREHDRSLLFKAYRTLFRPDGPPLAVPEGLLSELQDLQGLDEELDLLILNRTSRPTEAWRAPLVRLLDDLARG